MKTRRHLFVLVLALLMISGLSTGIGIAQEAQQAQLDRTVLPMKPPYAPPITILDARDAKAPPRWQVKAPKDAPNVLIIMLDDLGFAGTSAFGGVTPTPTFDKLVRNGLRFNQFHSTALCSPTRQALITGRNHHSGNMAMIEEAATAFPGNTGILPPDIAKLPEILQLRTHAKIISHS